MSKPAKDVKRDVRKQEVKSAIQMSALILVIVVGFTFYYAKGNLNEIPRLLLKYSPIAIMAIGISSIRYIKTWSQNQSFNIQQISQWLFQIGFWYVLLFGISTIFLGLSKDSTDVVIHMPLAALLAIPLTIIVLAGLYIYRQKTAINIKFLVGVFSQIGFIALLVYGTINLTIPSLITGSPDFQLNPVLLAISTVLMVAIIYLLYWGNIMLGLKRYDDAIAHTNFWIRLRPNGAALYIRRAAQQIAKRDFDTARSDVEYAKSIAPNQPEILNQVASLYIEFGELENALETVENALQSSPELDSKIEGHLLSTKITIYLLLADYDMANALCKEMLKLDIPQLEEALYHSDAYQKWGITFLLSGDYERALNEFEKSKALINNPIPALLGIAATHYKMSNMDAVRETWRELRAKNSQWDFDEIKSQKSNILAFAAIVQASYEATHS